MNAPRVGVLNFVFAKIDTKAINQENRNNDFDNPPATVSPSNNKFPK